MVLYQIIIGVTIVGELRIYLQNILCGTQITLATKNRMVNMNDKKLSLDSLVEKGVKLKVSYSEEEKTMNINAQYDDENYISILAAWRLNNLIKSWHRSGILHDYKRGVL